MAQVMKDIVTWLKQWYYTESEVDTLIGGLQSQINNKANASDLTAKADKTNGASQITDTSAGSYTNISTTLTNASTQAEINSAINTKIGTLMGVDWIVVVSELPTASASTMGKLYLVAISGSGDNNFKEYVTVENSGAYSWEKLGEISGSGLSVDWSDITNKPSSFTPASHTHGQISNDGKITSTAVTVASGDNLLITDASDSSKIKRVANILASHLKDSTAHNNIGTSANATQDTINSGIDTALGNKISKSNTVGLMKNDGSVDTTSYISDVSGKSDKTATLGTTITLVDKGQTNEGCIIFNTIS